MSTSGRLSDFVNNGSNSGERTGRYPNTHQPNGFQFDTIAVAIAPKFSGNNATPPNGNQTGVASPTQLGEVFYQAALAARDESSSLSDATYPMVDGDDDVSTQGAEDSDRIIEDQEPTHFVESGGSSDAEQSVAPESLSVARGTKRKPNSSGKPTRARSGKAGRQRSKAENKESLTKLGSSRRLAVESFATAQYVKSQRARLSSPIVKACQPLKDDAAFTPVTLESLSLGQEARYLITLIRTLILIPERGPFVIFENSRRIDKEIAIGFKLGHLEEDEDEDSDIEQPKRGRKVNSTGRFNGLNRNLPPMNNVDDIFEDLTKRALAQGFLDYLKISGPRKLSIATLCSGTEAPVLALDMIAKYARKHTGYRLPYAHQLSCEIDPRKQAYIVRNFNPEIMFRDVTYMSKQVAPTAFGAEKAVPDNADIVVAGSSCIDYSILNRNRKDYGTSGESYETLTGVAGFARAHKPKIAILENVSSFPWGKVETLWRGDGYATQVVSVDSKDFYLPQTRSRGYMIALRREAVPENMGLNADQMVMSWAMMLEELQRRASSPFTEFLLEEGSAELQRYEREAAAALSDSKHIAWEKCRVETLSYRSTNRLGFKKPYTEWENNGSCKVPDSCNKAWFKRQVERIWETIDINFLRSVFYSSYDFAYKCRCFDLSQSCVRERDSKPWGMLGCITPTAIPYFSRRGGPLVGAETLSLQGIPWRKLILNRESSKQLVDLAGNAMTTTVVGAAIVAALTACRHIFAHRDDTDIELVEPLSESLNPPLFDYAPHWLLSKTDLTTEVRRPMTTAELRKSAFARIRLCSCETHILNRKQVFQQCRSCGYTSCENCGIKPEHKYHKIEAEALQYRRDAIDFEEQIRKALPPRIIVHGLALAHAAAVSATHGALGDEYTAAIDKAAAEDCRLMTVKRDQGWSIVYESQNSRLVLSCQPNWDGRVLSGNNFHNLESAMTVEWIFYAKPGCHLAANSPVREDLSHPVAKLTCSDSLFDGQWEIREAVNRAFTLEVVGHGDAVPSWEAKQGLQNSWFKNNLTWPTLELRKQASTSSSASKVPDDINGTYDWLQDCGGACGSLRVKQVSSTTSKKHPLFLFLDPSPMANATEDAFVLARRHHKLGINDVREVVARFPPNWRPFTRDRVSTVECEITSQWTTVEDVHLQEHAPEDLKNVHIASPETALRVSETPCQSLGIQVAWCEFIMSSEARDELDLVFEKRFELVKNRFALQALSWIVNPIGHALKLTEWQNIPVTDDLANRCTTCAPKTPGVVWKTVVHKNQVQIRPYENKLEACEYERKINAAPEVVTADLLYQPFDDNSGVATLILSFNIMTLIHQAVANLYESSRRDLQLSTIHWRATAHHGHDFSIPFPRVQLRSCQGEKASSQPPSFRKTGQALSEQQLKSFEWMKHREEPHPIWDEQEIVEAVVTPMSLRLEAKVTSRRSVLGGVLADDVGYGKTALIIALIDHHFQTTQNMAVPKFVEGTDDMIPLKATLILVPPGLIEQWNDEITKFVGDTYKVLILTKRNFVQKSRVSTFQEADIILAPWDLFDDKYFAHVARMSRAPHTPISAGRGFEDWFDMALNDLKMLVKNSHGLRPDRLKSAWRRLKEDKYDKFIELSRRNKRGGAKTANSTDEVRPKRVKRTLPEVVEPVEPFLALHVCVCNRIVLDEFPYLDSKQECAILGLRGNRHWILSGTPPYDKFEGVSKMAKLLGTTLGIPDDAATRYTKVKDNGVIEASGGEALRWYATYHTPNWNKARYELAERFLDFFVRKNTAFVVGIEKQDHYHLVVLPALERALYIETFLIMVNQGVIVGKKDASTPPNAKKTDATAPAVRPGPEPSRITRIADHLKASVSPEDALITLCSTIPEFAATTSSTSPCKVAIKEKEDRLVNKVQDIYAELRGAYWIISAFGDKVQSIPDIYNYLRSVQENHFGDSAVCQTLIHVIAHAEQTKTWTSAKCIEEKKPADDAANQKDKAAIEREQQYKMRADASNEPTNLSSLSRTEDLKLRADKLIQWTVALTDIVRERRFLVGTEACLTGQEIECSSCGNRSHNYSAIVFLSRCGHSSCQECYRTCFPRGVTTAHCFDGFCGSEASRSSVVEASDLTITPPSAWARDHGSKMAAITDLLLQISRSEKVLVFVQFARIADALKKIMKARGITFADAFSPNANSAAENVRLFKEGRQGQICLLQLDSPNAAGWNLQAANHVVFVSTLAAKTQHEYNSSITQAIGRVLRLGQTKAVHVYHFLAEKTIEVNMLEERTGKTLVRRDGGFLLLEEGEMGEAGDVSGFGGLPFVGAAAGTEEVEVEVDWA